MRRLASLQELAGPVVLVGGAALLGTLVSASTQAYFTDTLVKVAIVVALYVFIGNSGVLSFGHVAFVALGVWTAGVLSVPVAEKPAIMPSLAHFLLHRHVGNVVSLLLAAVVGGVAAFVVGIPLMRLSGLAAGIATFAVLEITHNLLQYDERIGPGLNTFSSVPETTGLRQAALGALVCVALAFVYAKSRFGRLLRATREDDAAARAVGTSVYRQRLLAFTISGLLAGLAGGLYVHLLPVQADSVYLDLTFITLAMLVVGGSGSLFGAVVGALAVSALDSWLSVAENGTSLLGLHVDLPAGTAEIAVGVLMAAVLILRPNGLTNGRELRLRRSASSARTHSGSPSSTHPT
jgi:branched-chain amino acid transport system permease protein